VDAGGSAIWMVSSDGFWLGRGRGEGSRLLSVTGVEGLKAKAGTKINSPEVLNAVAVIDGLSSKLKKKITSVSAPSVDETSLRTKDDIEIFVGEATEMAEKDRIVRSILSEHDGVVYINVRVTDRPTWRGLTDASE